MQPFYIIGNLKQAGSLEYLQRFAKVLQAAQHLYSSQQVILLPPVTHLQATVKLFESSGCLAGAQMVDGANSIACTGLYNADMVADVGGSFVLVGHSERRALGDNSAQLRLQYRQAVCAGLTPILCVGESYAERTAGQTEAVIDQQLSAIFAAKDFAQLPKHDIVIAYEPVWAVGAGQAARTNDVTNVFKQINARINVIDKFARKALCYGGSVNEKNAAHFAQLEYVSGLLIGRVSLEIDRFMGVIKACNGF